MIIHTNMSFKVTVKKSVQANRNSLNFRMDDLGGHRDGLVYVKKKKLLLIFEELNHRVYSLN